MNQSDKNQSPIHSPNAKYLANTRTKCVRYPTPPGKKRQSYEGDEDDTIHIKPANELKLPTISSSLPIASQVQNSDDSEVDKPIVERSKSASDRYRIHRLLCCHKRKRH